jgi:hypothetical protein
MENRELFYVRLKLYLNTPIERETANGDHLHLFFAITKTVGIFNLPLFCITACNNWY